MYVAQKGGKHPLCQKYNDLVRQIEEVGREHMKLQSEARRLLPKPVYKLDRAEEDPGYGVRFYLTLANPEVFDNHLQTWGILDGSPEKHVRTVGYKLVNGVLLSRGGGHAFFGSSNFDNEPTILSEDEWDRLRLCLQVPETLRQKNTFCAILNGSAG